MQAFFRRHRSYVFYFCLLFVVRGAFADHNYVPSGSMEPTIQIGDSLLVNRAAYDLKIPFSGFTLVNVGEPERGDIVVFHNPQSDVRMVKRLVGMPGDRLYVRNGLISINGQPVPGSEVIVKAFAESPHDEVVYTEQLGSHVATIKRTKSLLRFDELEVVIPADHYFAMGDNRDNSHDSRGWGLIPREKIVGRAEGVIYNVSFNPLPNIKPERVGLKFL